MCTCKAIIQTLNYFAASLLETNGCVNRFISWFIACLWRVDYSKNNFMGTKWHVELWKAEMFLWHPHILSTNTDVILIQNIVFCFVCKSFSAFGKIASWTSHWSYLISKIMKVLMTRKHWKAAESGPKRCVSVATWKQLQICGPILFQDHKVSDPIKVRWVSGYLVTFFMDFLNFTKNRSNISKTSWRPLMNTALGDW